MKSEVWDWISDNEERIIEASDKIWHLAELGLVEEKSAEYLAKILEDFITVEFALGLNNILQVSYDVLYIDVVKTYIIGNRIQHRYYIGYSVKKFIPGHFILIDNGIGKGRDGVTQADYLKCDVALKYFEPINNITKFCQHCCSEIICLCFYYI